MCVLQVCHWSWWPSWDWPLSSCFLWQPLPSTGSTWTALTAGSVELRMSVLSRSFTTALWRACTLWVLESCYSSGSDIIVIITVSVIHALAYPIFSWTWLLAEIGEGGGSGGDSEDWKGLQACMHICVHWHAHTYAHTLHLSLTHTHIHLLAHSLPPCIALLCLPWHLPLQFCFGKG